MKLDAGVIIVGSGIFGLASAIQIKRKFGITPTIIEKRNHIGGNAYSYKDNETNIDVHKYGSHIFHTNNEIVWEFVNKYSEWIPYEHRVFLNSKGQIYPLPINLLTLSIIKGNYIPPHEAQKLLEVQLGGELKSSGLNFEEKAISLVGPELYELIYRGYTEKQWGTHPRNLPANILTRLPIRSNFDSRYFSDKYQALPKYGYAAFLENLANASEANIVLNTEWKTISSIATTGIPIIYTGPIDEFFDYILGELEWRTLDFKIKKLDVPDFQGSPVINYADAEVNFTRIHEFKHYPIDPEYDTNKTIIMEEFSRIAKKDDDKYYPIETERNRKLYKEYLNLAQKNFPNVIFAGRLGGYKYLDMHMAIASAFSKVENEFSNLMSGPKK
jgi:UDP-galactopyranose mutase